MKNKTTVESMAFALGFVVGCMMGLFVILAIMLLMAFSV